MLTHIIVYNTLYECEGFLFLFFVTLYYESMAKVTLNNPR